MAQSYRAMGGVRDAAATRSAAIKPTAITPTTAKPAKSAAAPAIPTAAEAASTAAPASSSASAHAREEQSPSQPTQNATANPENAEDNDQKEKEKNSAPPRAMVHAPSRPHLQLAALLIRQRDVGVLGNNPANPPHGSHQRRIIIARLQAHPHLAANIAQQSIRQNPLQPHPGINAVLWIVDGKQNQHAFSRVGIRTLPCSSPIFSSS